MNNSKKLLLGAGLALLAAAGLQAQESSLKIGIVNLQALTVESPQGREMSDRMSELFADRQRELNAKQTELDEKNSNWERDRETMGSEQLRTTERDIITLRREITQMNEALQQDFQLEQDASQRDLSAIFLSHVREVAEANDYDLVLTGGVVYFSDAVNITPQVLGALQETFSSQQQD